MRTLIVHRRKNLPIYGITHSRLHTSGEKLHGGERERGGVNAYGSVRKMEVKFAKLALVLIVVCCCTRHTSMSTTHASYLVCQVKYSYHPHELATLGKRDKTLQFRDLNITTSFVHLFHVNEYHADVINLTNPALHALYSYVRDKFTR